MKALKNLSLWHKGAAFCMQDRDAKYYGFPVKFPENDHHYGSTKCSPKITLFGESNNAIFSLYKKAMFVIETRDSVPKCMYIVNVWAY